MIRRTANNRSSRRLHHTSLEQSRWDRQVTDVQANVVAPGISLGDENFRVIQDESYTAACSPLLLGADSCSEARDRAWKIR